MPRPLSLCRPLWRLALCAWLMLVFAPVLGEPRLAVCCASMPSAVMTMAGRAMAGPAGHHPRPAARPVVAAVGRQAASRPWSGHASCLLCAGAVWLASRELFFPPRVVSPGRLLRFSAAPAPEGDWRRRLRPPLAV